MSKSCSLSCKTQKCEVKLNQAETSFHPQKTWAMKTAGNSWTSHDGAGDTVLKSSFHYLYLLIPQRVTGAGVYPPLPWMRGHISSSLSQGWYSQPFRLTTAPPSGIYSEHPVWYTTMMIHTHTHTHTHTASQTENLTSWSCHCWYSKCCITGSGCVSVSWRRFSSHPRGFFSSN